MFRKFYIVLLLVLGFSTIALADCNSGLDSLYMIGPTGTVCSGDLLTFKGRVKTKGGWSVDSVRWHVGGTLHKSANIVDTTLPTGNITLVFKVYLRNGGARCEDSVSRTLDVDGVTIKSITAPNSICSGSPVNLSALVTGNDDNWKWRFGDGDSSASENPSHTFNIANGNITVVRTLSLTVTTNDADCPTRTLTRNITIIPKPDVQFSFTPDGACSPALVAFTNTSVHLPAGSPYLWNFGNGITSKKKDTAVTYTSFGNGNTTFFASLTVTASGCSNTATKAITVKRQPEVKASAPQPFLCTTSFTNLNKILAIINQSPGHSYITQYKINWDDGTPIDSFLPSSYPVGTPKSHTLTDLGHYDVLFSATGTNTCTSDTVVKIVYARKPNSLLGAPPSNEACAMEPLKLVNRSVDILPWTVYTLRFDDGDSLVVTGDSLIAGDTVYFHAFPSNCTDTGFSGSSTNGSGGYLVELEAKNTCGTEKSKWEPIRIYPIPVADFRTDIVCKNDSTEFKNYTRIFSCIPSPTASYTWIFGDGDTAHFSRIPIDYADSVQQVVHHVYPDTGTYFAKLIACDDSLNNRLGCQCDSIVKKVIVQRPPNMSFSAPRVCHGFTSSFASGATGNNGIPIVYTHWSLGYNGDTSNLSSVNYLYPLPDTFMVTLTATDSVGCTSSLTKPVIVDSLPIASFIFDSVCAQTPTHLISTSTGAAPINKYVWDFGDGQKDSIAIPDTSHIYASGGNYLVELDVVDVFGCRADTQITIKVWRLPSAAFSVDSVCFGDSAKFINSSTLGDTSLITYTWNLGDGTITNIHSPTHLYSDTGTYGVNLNLIDGNGCTSATSGAVAVMAIPVANFLPNIVCFGTATSFADSTKFLPKKGNSWLWKFDTLGTAASKNASFVFPDSGSFSTKLIVKTSIGCTDSITKPLYVKPNPVALFSADTVCRGDTTTFVNLSVAFSGATIAGASWKFGNGKGSGALNPRYAYPLSGHYADTLSVTDSKGCSASIIDSVLVKAQPSANFVFTPACQNVNIKFNNTSVANEGSLTSFLWNLGDGSPQLPDTNVQHTYPSDIAYQVSLIVGNTAGCLDTVVKTVQVFKNPIVQFSVADTCFRQPSRFNNTSLAVSGGFVGFRWELGSGGASTDSIPKYTFPSAGNIPVKLVVTNTPGCSDSLTKNIVVKPTPKAAFTADTVCSGSSTHFTNTSTVNGGSALLGYNWQFTATQSSILTNPTFLFDSAGLWSVQLVAHNTDGCRDTLTKNIQVKTKPSANFLAPTVCVNTPTQFGSLSTAQLNDIVTTRWNFGDGSPAALATNPTHTYVSTGNKSVKLWVQTTNFCADSLTRTVKVNAQPTANFTYSGQCQGGGITFNNTSVVGGAPITSILWTFGDGDSSTQASPLHSYLLPGTYSVTLMVTDTNGCSSTVTKSVLVNAAPVAHFKFDTACLKSITTFTDSSYSTTSAIVSRLWQFGDGGFTALPNPTRKYASAAIYNVKLKVTDGLGCSDSTTYQVPVLPNPVADFSAAAQCQGQLTTFNQLSLATNSPITSYLWNFGDGALAMGTTTTHTYATAGSYNAKLIIADQAGCADTVTKLVEVRSLPVANFSPLVACSKNKATFNDLSAGTSGFGIKTWNWQIGATVYSTKTIEHTFNTAGNATVTLTVTDSANCSGSTTKTVNVRQSPTPSFTGSTVCFGSATQLVNTSALAGSPLVRWHWDFAGLDTSNAANPNYKFPSADSFAVALSMVDLNGCFGSTTSKVSVSPAPNAQFSAPNVCLGNLVSFNNTSNTLKGIITSTQWNFGNGQTSGLSSPTQNYTSAGQFAVRLIVSNSLTCSDTVNQTVRVYALPTANFTFATACAGGTTQFTSTSVKGTTPINQYLWNFGSGANSVLPNPGFVFANPGTQNIGLTVTDSGGCSATINKAISIDSVPFVNFTVPTTCFPSKATFTSTAYGRSSNLTAYRWYFGDGDSAATQHSQHSYTTYGNYTVTHTAIDQKGCRASFQKVIRIHPKPSASFTVSNHCEGSTAPIVNLSSGAGDTIGTYNWNMGSGVTSADQNPSVIFADTGNRQISLIVTTLAGCSDTTDRPVRVLPKPLTDFLAPPVCFGQASVFTNATNMLGGTQLNARWLFGDGTPPLLAPASTSHTYATPGIYTVRLVVTNTDGCAQSKEKQVFVDTLPRTNFSFSNACIGSATQFTNLSIATSNLISGYSWNFGDGSATSAITDPTHLFPIGNTYNVSLTTTDIRGCQSTTTKPVAVKPNPVFDFVAYPACSGQPSRFAIRITAAEMGKVGAMNWNFGAGLPSKSGDSVVAIIPTGGVRNITLTVTDTNGCSATVTKSLNFGYAPQAYFGSSALCADQSIAFTDSSAVVAPAVPTNWWWDFGDGSPTSASQSPSHQYTSTGNFTIRFAITDNQGCTDTVARLVTIKPQPTANFSYQASCVGDTTFFADQSTAAGSASQIMAWHWTFGDTSAPATVKNPQHIFSLSGKYPVTLKVTDVFGCENTKIDTVRAYPLPVADFVVVAACANRPTSFIDTSLAVEGTLSSFAWNFGDGALSAGKSTTHNYSAAGVYNVGLTVTNTSGCSRSISKSVTVSNTPIANFTHDTVCANAAMQFANTSIAAGFAPISRLHWDFGNGDTSDMPTPLEAYAPHGFYSVTLTIADTNGCTDQKTKTVLVRALPLPAFNASTGCTGAPTQFVNQSAAVHSADSVVAYRWNFGLAGATSLIKNPNYTYTQAGTYQVKLVVTDNHGCADSLTKPVTSPVPPVPGFAFSGTCAGLTTTFTDTSQTFGSPITLRSWNFDGTTVNTTNASASFTFASLGTKNITLTVTDANGCTRSGSKQITVHPNVVPNFSFSKVCLGDTTQFVNLSVGNGFAFSKFRWNFSDGGTTDTLPDPGHRFSTSGNYAVKLYVENANGCYDSITKQVTINPLPVPNFSVSPVCFGDTSKFQNLSSSPNGQVLSYHYDFGLSGGTSIIPSPKYKYPTFGDYPATLMVTDALGCKSEITRTAVVRRLPSVAFNVVKTCVTDSVRFVNTTTVYNTSTFNSHWVFSTGDSVQTKNSAVKYTIPGDYWARLRVVDAFGCRSQFADTFRVSPAPVAGFTANTVCQNNATSFISTASSTNMVGAVYSYQFGDGNTSALASPQHTYGSAGLFTAIQTFTDGNGCTDTAQRVVKVRQNPNINFGTPITTCQQSVLNFFDSTTAFNGPSVAWVWSFGDGTQAFQRNPTKQYPLAGSFQVKLRVTDSVGCFDSLTKSYTLFPKPDVSFVVNDTACVLVPAQFTYSGSGSVTQYDWVFGDGSGSTVPSPSHSYGSVGSYLVRLIGRTPEGCSDTASKLMNVGKIAVPYFTKSHDSACGPVNVVAVNQSTGIVNKYIWNFGNGFISQAVNPPGTVMQPGLLGDTIYKISLTVINQCGTNTYVDSVKIFPQPVAKFAVSSASGCSPLQVTLNNQSLGNATSFLWNFGNGGVSTLKNPPMQVYTTNLIDTSTYMIRLTASNFCGQDTAQRRITVFPKKVKAFFNVDKTFGCQGLVVNFTSFSQNATTYFYDFGDGTTSVTTNPMHVYNTSGVFTVKHIAGDGCGLDTAIIQITVFPKPTFAMGISPNDTVCAGVPIQFSNASAVVGGITWNFGDGTTSTLASPIKRYSNAGSYNVFVQVISQPNGCIADTTLKVRILGAPNARIDSSVFAQLRCQNTAIGFSNLSTGGTNYLWNFGDSGSATVFNPTHQFILPGNYTVNLIATNDSGCSDTASVKVKIGATPKAAFTTAKPFSCGVPASLNLTNTSLGAFELRWNFGNGATSSQANPATSFTQPGVYNIRLIALSSNGCADTAYRTFEVIEQPVAKFDLDSAMKNDTIGGGTTGGGSICLGKPISLDNFSQKYDSLVWDFGDGHRQYNQNTDYTYQLSGNYNIRLIAINGGGKCADTLVRSGLVEVLPLPFARFFYENIDSLINGNFISLGKVKFTSLSQGGASYHWNFGDSIAIASNDSIIAHYYKKAGNYFVTLTATTPDGCSDTYGQDIVVNYFAGLHMPNAVMPDGLDVGYSEFIGKGVFLKTFRIEIFDTWGGKVWDEEGVDANGSPAENTAFKGRKKDGAVLPAGTYAYKVTYSFVGGNGNEESRTGDVTIVR